MTKVPDTRADHSPENPMENAPLLCASQDKQFVFNSAGKKQSAQFSFPFGKCRVCTDDATGVHYGVSTCEGCKGFFKRSIADMKKEKYKCMFGHKCSVSTNRTKCKSCRFEKCLQVGMSYGGVKKGRISKALKEKAFLNLKLNEENTCNDKVSAKKSYIFDKPSSDEQSNANVTAFQDIRLLSTTKEMLTLNPQDQDKTMYSFVASTFLKTIAYESDEKINVSLSPYTPSNCSSVNSSSSLTDCLYILNNYRFHKVKCTETSQIFSTDPSLSSTIMCDSESYLFDSSHKEYILKAYEEMSQDIWEYRDRALCLIRAGTTVHEGHDAATNEIWYGTMQSMVDLANNFFAYVRHLPGFSRLTKRDLSTMAKTRIYEFPLLRNAVIFIDGEHYWRFCNGIVYTKRQMAKILGSYLTQVIFNFERELNNLNLTKKELSLFIPFILAQPESVYEDKAIFQELHDYYKRELMAEFVINKRSFDFFSKWIKIVDKLNSIHELQVSISNSIILPK